MNIVTMKEMFGGSWDGDTEEMHGYVVQGPSTLKIEILKREDGYMVSVFDAGTCLFSGTTHEPYETIAKALHDAPED